MYLCEKCGHPFRDPEPTGKVHPSYTIESITDAPDYVCPFCGSEDYEEAQICESCGQWHTGCEDICAECIEIAETKEAEAQKTARMIVLDARSELSEAQIEHLEAAV